MKKILLVLGITVGLAFGSGAAQAQTCVNNLFTGLVYNASCCECETYKLMKMVIHQNNNAWVSVSMGAFYKQADGTAKSSSMSQLFNDRQFFRSGIGWQPFDIQYPDSHSVTITTGGAITVTNHTWGFNTNLTAACSGNLILGSNSWEYYLISYGSTSPRIC